MKTLKKVFNGIMIAGALAIGAGLAAKLIMEKDTIPKIICYAGGSKRYERNYWSHINKRA